MSAALHIIANETPPPFLVALIRHNYNLMLAGKLSAMHYSFKVYHYRVVMTWVGEGVVRATVFERWILSRLADGPPSINALIATGTDLESFALFGGEKVLKRPIPAFSEAVNRWYDNNAWWSDMVYMDNTWNPNNAVIDSSIDTYDEYGNYLRTLYFSSIDIGGPWTSLADFESAKLVAIDRFNTDPLAKWTIRVTGTYNWNDVGQDITYTFDDLLLDAPEPFDNAHISVPSNLYTTSISDWGGRGYTDAVDYTYSLDRINNVKSTGFVSAAAAIAYLQANYYYDRPNSVSRIYGAPYVVNSSRNSKITLDTQSTWDDGSITNGPTQLSGRGAPEPTREQWTYSTSAGWTYGKRMTSSQFGYTSWGQWEQYMYDNNLTQSQDRSPSNYVNPIFDLEVTIKGSKVTLNTTNNLDGYSTTAIGHLADPTSYFSQKQSWFYFGGGKSETFTTDASGALWWRRNYKPPPTTP